VHVTDEVCLDPLARLANAIDLVAQFVEHFAEVGELPGVCCLGIFGSCRCDKRSVDVAKRDPVLIWKAVVGLLCDVS
jgi:hypothetical protein